MAKKDNTLNISLLITVIYYLFWFMASFKKLFDLRLNEIGDFMAGISAPVAVYWFVLAYRLQGKEMRETKEELAKQVELGKAQLDIEIKKRQEERERIINENKPIFAIGTRLIAPNNDHTFYLSNTGSKVEVSNISFEPDSGFSSTSKGYIDRGESVSFVNSKIDQYIGKKIRMHITYKDGVGNKFMQKFETSQIFDVRKSIHFILQDTKEINDEDISKYFSK